jgi:hypothetical protein
MFLLALDLFICTVQQTSPTIVEVVLGHLAEPYPRHAHNVGEQALIAAMVGVFIVELTKLVPPLVHRNRP